MAYNGLILSLESQGCASACVLHLVMGWSAADAAAPYERQHAEDEDRHRPEAHGVDIGAHARIISADERQVREHPGEQPVCIGPDLAGVRHAVLEVPPGVERRKPVAS